MPHAESPTSTGQATIDNVTLYVNDGPLSSSEVAPLRASYPSEPIEELYHRYQTDGYVFLKGLLPRDDVLAARRAYFESMAPSGVIEKGTDPVDGIFNSEARPADYPGIGAGTMKGSRPGDTDKAATFVDLALKAHTEDWYAGSEDGNVQGFCNHPVLREFVAMFTGWGDNTLTVKRTLLRNNTPGNKAIGVHYDQSFMRYGEPTAVTAWVPMGDVSIEGGGLIYLQDGKQIGKEIEADFGRTYGRKWLVSAYEAGDVVLHDPHMIHASTVNYDPQRKIRLGTDLRFVNKARPWDTRWNKHYTFGDGV